MIRDPEAIKPMLCKLTEKPFNSPDYIWEPKYDGERLTVLVKAPNTVVKMWARSGREKAYMYPDLKFSVVKDCLLDGEVVSGSSFNGIQHRANRQNGIAQAVKDYPATYEVFDIINLADTPIGGFPLIKRKEILQIICQETGNVKLAPYVQDGVALFDAMKANQLEGVVGKAKNSVYHEDKREWLKVKCWQEAMFVAVGYTAGTGHRASQFGALVLADTKGNYVGSVGSGFTEETIGDIMKLFSPQSCLFPREPEKATWIKPFPVKVKFLEFSNDGMVRFPVFKGVVNG